MNRQFRFVWGVLLAAALIGGGMCAGDNAPPPVQMTENSAQIKCPDTMMVFAISPRSDRIAFVARVKNGHKTVNIDDTIGKVYDEIRPLGGKQSVVFSDDSKHLAYVARSGKTWCVVLDTKEGPSMPSVEDPQFSPDGLSVAYGGVADGKPVLVIDSAAGPSLRNLDGMEPGAKVSDRLALSADFKHWAYVAAPASPDGTGPRPVMVDGKAIGSWESASKPILSPDGAHWGFLAKTTKPDSTTEEWAMIDGQKFGPYENLSSLVFSPDSKHWAFIRNGNGSGPVFPGTPQVRGAVVRDGKLEGAYDSIQAPLVFSPNSSRLAFVANVGSGQCCILDGKAGQTAQTMHPPTFSPDSLHLAYVIETPNGVGVVVDDKPGPAARDIANDNAIVFSPDSKHFAYLAVVDGGKRVPIMDGKPVGVPGVGAPTLVFTPDSAHLVAQDFKHITVDAVSVNTPFLSASPIVFTSATKFQSIIANKEKNAKRFVSENFYHLDVELRGGP